MPFLEKIPFFVLILCLSLLNNLLIPFAIYFRKFGRRGYQGKGGCNFWGVLMDGVLAGLINLAAMNFLLELRPEVAWPDLIVSLLFGFLTMRAMHAWMVWRKWQVWIMPEPGRWNEGGFWHMVSATLQMGFLALVLLLILRQPFYRSLLLTRLTLLAELFFGLVFLPCFSLGNRGLKLGRFEIGSGSW